MELSGDGAVPLGIINQNVVCLGTGGANGLALEARLGLVFSGYIYVVQTPDIDPASSSEPPLSSKHSNSYSTIHNFL